MTAAPEPQGNGLAHAVAEFAYRTQREYQTSAHPYADALARLIYMAAQDAHRYSSDPLYGFRAALLFWIEQCHSTARFWRDRVRPWPAIATAADAVREAQHAQRADHAAVELAAVIRALETEFAHHL